MSRSPVSGGATADGIAGHGCFKYQLHGPPILFEEALLRENEIVRPSRLGAKP
jgi:hypothetical protein